MKRKYLVVVRAGEKSLHPQWLGNGDRNWDLVVSWYGATTYKKLQDETVVNIKGGKCDGFLKTVQALPQLLTDYDYFWLPDDDIETDCTTINRLFETAEKLGLPLCQPALSQDSYYSWFHLLQSKSFSVRFTSFVEVMVPCLSAERLVQVLPLFEGKPEASGLDLLWSRFERDNRFRAAVLDDVVVKHTRPVGQFLKGASQKSGYDAHAETLQLMQHYGITHPFNGNKCYAGILKNQSVIRGTLMTRLHMIKDYLQASRQRVQHLAYYHYLALLFLPDAPLTYLPPPETLALQISR